MSIDGPTIRTRVRREKAGKLMTVLCHAADIGSRRADVTAIGGPGPRDFLVTQPSLDCVYVPKLTRRTWTILHLPPKAPKRRGVNQPFTCQPQIAQLFGFPNF